MLLYHDYGNYAIPGWRGIIFYVLLPTAAGNYYIAGLFMPAGRRPTPLPPSRSGKGRTRVKWPQNLTLVGRVRTGTLTARLTVAPAETDAAGGADETARPAPEPAPLAALPRSKR